MQRSFHQRLSMRRKELSPISPTSLTWASLETKCFLVVSARWVKEHFNPTRKNISSRARKPRLLDCAFFSLVRIPGASGLGVAVVPKHPNWFGSLLCHAKTLLLRYDGVWTSSPKQALGYSYVLAIEEGGVSLVVPQYMRDEIVSQCQKNLEAGHEALTKGGDFLVQHSESRSSKLQICRLWAIKIDL
eukprot:g61991.t1